VICWDRNQASARAGEGKVREADSGFVRTGLTRPSFLRTRRRPALTTNRKCTQPPSQKQSSWAVARMRSPRTPNAT